MATYYAWSNFPVERNEWGQVTKTIEVGEEVTAQKLGMSKEEFDEHVELGTVREEEYPDVPDHVSPAEYAQQQAAHDTAVQELELTAAGATYEEQAEAAAAAGETAETAPKAAAASSGTKAAASSDKG